MHNKRNLVFSIGGQGLTQEPIMQKYSLSFLKPLVITVLCVSMTACKLFDAPAQPEPNFFLPPKENVDVTGIGLNASNAVYLHNTIENVRILQIGNNYTIFIPSDTFFEQQSGFIIKSNYGMLNRIATSLRKFDSLPITVTAYTDNVGSRNQNIWLANQEAQNIVTYLWIRGINNIYIQPVSMGEQYPIATNSSLRGSRYNRHIEITFRCN